MKITLIFCKNFFTLTFKLNSQVLRFHRQSQRLEKVEASKQEYIYILFPNRKPYILKIPSPFSVEKTGWESEIKKIKKEEAALDFKIL